MVTSDTNRAQVTAIPPYERPVQGLPSGAESVAEQGQVEERSAGSPISIREPFWFLSLVVAGATIGSTWGLATSVLAILGLAGVYAAYVLPVAAITLGLSFVAVGAVGAGWARTLRFTEQENSRERAIFSVGVAAMVIAGLAAIVLGLLTFVFLSDTRFGAIAVIALGLGLLCHSGVMRGVSQFTHCVTYQGRGGQRPSGPFAINALSLAPPRDFVVGLGSVVLGILAMMHVVPAILELVALLVLGCAVAATVSTLCGASLAALKAIYAKG